MYRTIQLTPTHTYTKGLSGEEALYKPLLEQYLDNLLHYGQEATYIEIGVRVGGTVYACSGSRYITGA